MGQAGRFSVGIIFKGLKRSLKELKKLKKPALIYLDFSYRNERLFWEGEYKSPIGGFI